MASINGKGVKDLLLPACGNNFTLLQAKGNLSTDEMVDFYNSIDVICISSIAEGTPLPLIEAMACGCFPVCCDVGIVPEIIQNEKNGLIVKRTPDAFREALNWCATHLDFIREAGLKNATLMQNEKSWEISANKFRDILHSILKESSSYQNDDLTCAQPEKNTDYSKHFNRINPNLSDSAYHSALDYIAEDIAPLLPTDKNARILEVGTGHGHLLRFLIEKGYRRIMGIDMSEELLESIRPSYAHQVELLAISDAKSFISKYKNKLDCILMIDMLEHVSEEEAKEIITLAHESLRPGGKIIIRTPNMSNILGGYSLHMDPTHRQGFTEWTLIDLLEKGGLESPQVHVPMVRAISKRWLFNKFNLLLHKTIYKINDRVPPKSFNKNIVVWAKK